MMSTKERIAMVQLNLSENERNYKAGNITRAQYKERRADGRKCISEIRATWPAIVKAYRKENRHE